MKKRRLILIAMIVAIFAITAVLGLAACQKKGEDTQTPGDEDTVTPPAQETVYYDGNTPLLAALATALQNSYTFSAEINQTDLYGRYFDLYTVTGAGNADALSARFVSEYYSDYMGVREKYNGGSPRDMLVTFEGTNVLFCSYTPRDHEVELYSFEYTEGNTPLDYLLQEDIFQPLLKIAMSDASLMTLSEGVYSYSGTLTVEDIRWFADKMMRRNVSFEEEILEALQNLTITVSKNAMAIATSYFSNLMDAEVTQEVTITSGTGEVDKSVYNQLYNIDNDCDVEIDGIKYWFNPAGYDYDEAGWVAYCSDGAPGSVVIPSAIGGRPVIAIGSEAFYESDITSIEIPSSVLYISDCAFKYCYSLTTVKLNKGLKKIEYDAFYYCKKLSSITLPEGLECIGDCAFYACERLGYINIPDSVTRIGREAFEYTAGYFYDDPSFDKLVSFDGNGVGYVGKWVVAYEYEWIEESSEIITLREGTVGIADWALSNISYLYCSDYEGDGDIFDGDLISYTKYLSLTYEEQNEFDCWYDYYICAAAIGGYKINDVIPVAIYESLSEAARDCFQICFYREADTYPITGVAVPESLKYIGRGSFYDNESVKTVSVFQNGVPTYTIPNLVKIGRDAFSYCYELEKLVIPASCTAIKNYAFTQCYYLQLKFADISTLQNFIFTNLAVDYDDNDGYPYYPAITAQGLEIKNGLVYIGSVCYGAYDEFSAEQLNIAAGTTEIGKKAFTTMDTWVDEIKLPNGLAKIGKKALRYVYADGINLPASLTEIGKKAFNDDSYFKTVVIDSAMFAALDLQGLYKVGFNFDYGAKVYYKNGLTPSAELLPYLTRLNLSAKPGYTAYIYSDEFEPVDCGEIELEEPVEIQFFTGKSSIYSLEATAGTDYSLNVFFDFLSEQAYYQGLYYYLGVDYYYFEEDDNGDYVLIEGVAAWYDDENDNHIGLQRYSKSNLGSTSLPSWSQWQQYNMPAPAVDGLVYLEFGIFGNCEFITPEAVFAVTTNYTPLTLGDSVELIAIPGSGRCLPITVTAENVGKTYFIYSEGDAYLSAYLANSDSDVLIWSEGYRRGNFIIGYTFQEEGTYQLVLSVEYDFSGADYNLVRICSVEKECVELLADDAGERAVSVVEEPSYLYIVKKAFKDGERIFRVDDEITEAEYDALDPKYQSGTYFYQYYDKAMTTKITFTFTEAGFYRLSLTAGETFSTLSSYGVHYVTFESASGYLSYNFPQGELRLEQGDSTATWDEGDEMYVYSGSDQYTYFEAGTITFYITAAPDSGAESVSVILSVMKGMTKADVFPG